MDTRRKIVAADLVPAGCCVVTGYFDVLQAGDIRDLSALPRPVAAVVLPFSDELLSQRARAELAAALRVIDYVVIADDPNADGLLERLRPGQIVRLEATQASRTSQLKEHVRKRQSG